MVGIRCSMASTERFVIRACDNPCILSCYEMCLLSPWCVMYRGGVPVALRSQKMMKKMHGKHVIRHVMGLDAAYRYTRYEI